MAPVSTAASIIKRLSRSLCNSSRMVSANGSANASEAVWKSMPCLARFARLFPSSHSKAMTHYDKRKYICQYNIARTKLRVRFDFFSRPVATLDDGKLVQYDGAIMMAKTQITLETEMQRRARQRANDLGVSLAEYFRRLVARDLARPETAARVDRIFDL